MIWPVFGLWVHARLCWVDVPLESGRIFVSSKLWLAPIRKLVLLGDSQQYIGSTAVHNHEPGNAGFCLPENAFLKSFIVEVVECERFIPYWVEVLRNCSRPKSLSRGWQELTNDERIR